MLKVLQDVIGNKNLDFVKLVVHVKNFKEKKPKE